MMNKHKKGSGSYNVFVMVCLVDFDITRPGDIFFA